MSSRTSSVGNSLCAIRTSAPRNPKNPVAAFVGARSPPHLSARERFVAANSSPRKIVSGRTKMALARACSAVCETSCGRALHVP